MNTRRRPIATPAPSPAPSAALDVFTTMEGVEVLPPATIEMSKLGRAMESVKAKLTVIDQFGKDVRDLIAQNPSDKAYDLSTKVAEKAADEVRKLARLKRLAIQNAWSEGKAVLRDLGDDLKSAAEGDIATLQKIEDNVKAQLDAKAQKEADRKAAHEKNIAAISALADGADTMSSEDIAARIQSIEAIVVDDSYEEFEAAAKIVRADVVGVLTQAKQRAIEREAEARRAAEVAAAQAAELAALREKEERIGRIKTRIQTIKDLPSQAEGTGTENIRQLLRLHEQSVPDSEHYGDLLEFAEMAHELTTTKLKALLDQSVADDAPADHQLEPEERVEIAAQDSPPPEWLAPEMVREFTARVAPPARGGGWRVAPTQTPAPTPQPTPAPYEDETAGAPDLLERSRDSVTMFFANYPDDDGGVPSSLYASMQRLKAAVDFISEFAD